LTAQPPSDPSLRRISSYVLDLGDGEATLRLQIGCARCAWADEGREAAVLRLEIDGHYASHLIVPRSGPADYQVLLGPLAAGHHRVNIDLDKELSAPDVGTVTASLRESSTLVPGPIPKAVDFSARAMAPFLYARPNTIGRFTDAPILMWYETAEMARGRSFRYSVVFTNEDGGTATDRLMATWGRTTDIEFVYGVEIDETGAVVREEFQGPSHQVQPFRGKHEGRHPLLMVATDNNMVTDDVGTGVRYALVPERFDLANQSREAVMDAHPWSYVLAAEEVGREGKIAPDAQAGSGKIPDPRQYVIVEACSELTNAALAFSIRAHDARGVSTWYDADRGRAEFRIVRSGCFRGGVPLPVGSGRPDAIRFRLWPRPGQPDAPAGSMLAVTRVNKVFTLGDDYVPRLSLFDWVGWLDLPATGDWRELTFPKD